MATSHMSDREARIVGYRGTYTYHNCIDDRSQPVQMCEARWAIDVVRMTAGRCHAPIERLTDLAHHKELIRRISAQGPKNGVPVRRQGNHLGSDQFGHESPRINSLNVAITISAGGNSLLCS